MLIQFSIKNFLSFQKEYTFTMQASSAKDHPEHLIEFRQKNSNNKALKILRSSIIYGPNASGKTNILKAFNLMRNLVINSSKETQYKEAINATPFLFDDLSKDIPSFFEATFIISETKYRYGFETNTKEIVSEWLFASPKGREATLFTREYQSIKIGSGFKQAKDLESKTRVNALFLSVASQFNVDIAQNIVDWFRNVFVMSDKDDYLSAPIIKLLENKHQRKRLSKIMKIADIGITNFEVEKIDIEKMEIPLSIKKMIMNDIQELKKDDDSSLFFKKLKSGHNRYDSNGNILDEIFLDFDAESAGTQKFLAILGPIINAMVCGTPTLIDEFGSNLHPHLTRFILDLIHSLPQHKQAQFIFVTHDISILQKEYFRKDQIWFTSKDRIGRTELYSLDDYKTRSEIYQKDYTRGKYGAIPIIGDPKDIIDIFTDENGNC